MRASKRKHQLAEMIVGMQGTLVAWCTADTMSFARISAGHPRLSMFVLGTMALLIAHMRSSCGRSKSRAVASAFVANRGASPRLATQSWSIPCCSFFVYKGQK